MTDTANIQAPAVEVRHRLRISMEYANLKTSDMAQLLDVDRATISRYLTGATRAKRPTLIAWALRCGVPFDWLLTGDNDDATVTLWYPCRERKTWHLIAA